VKAHGGIQPMQVANLPTAAAALGPFKASFDADEPMFLLGPLRSEDSNGGQIQRHVNTVVHSDSPVNLCRYHPTTAAFWLYYILDPITGVPGEPNGKRCSEGETHLAFAVFASQPGAIHATLRHIRVAALAAVGSAD
jgi:hypothetical protein